MSKKKKLIIIICSLAVIIIVAAGLFFFFGWKNRNQTNNPITSIKEELMGEEEVIGDLEYEDEAGFSFMYPKGIEVSDETPDDETYYTLLVLSRGDKKLTISAQDTKETKVENFISKSETYKDAVLYGATTLGGLSAKQYNLGDNLLTIVIDKGVLYLIEGPKDGDFWEKTQMVVVESFAFAGTQKNSSGSAVEDVIYEEEEVVE